MGKLCLQASSFIFDRMIIKVAGKQKKRNSSVEFDFWAESDLSFWSYLTLNDENFTPLNLNISEAIKVAGNQGRQKTLGRVSMSGLLFPWPIYMLVFFFFFLNESMSSSVCG